MTRWALGLCPKQLNCPRRSKTLSGFPTERHSSEGRMECNPRRGSSSDTKKTAQAHTPTTKATFQDAPAMRTCLVNVQEGSKLKNIQGKSCYYRIKCITATFLATFIWRRPLNSVTSANVTHKEAKGVSNGTDTQVRTQVNDKCRIKMVQKGYIT